MALMCEVQTQCSISLITIALPAGIAAARRGGGRGGRRRAVAQSVDAGRCVTQRIVALIFAHIVHTQQPRAEENAYPHARSPRPPISHTPPTPPPSLNPIRCQAEQLGLEGAPSDDEDRGRGGGGASAAGGGARGDDDDEGGRGGGSVSSAAGAGSLASGISTSSKQRRTTSHGAVAVEGVGSNASASAASPSEGVFCCCCIWSVRLRIPCLPVVWVTDSMVVSPPSETFEQPWLVSCNWTMRR